MAERAAPYVIADLRGGRNGYLPAWAIAENECADAVNVDFYQSLLGRKRGGSEAPTTTSQPFTGVISSLGRHVPSTDETLAELWGADDAATPVVGRLAGGTTWTTPTLKDNLTGNGWDVSFASINSKLLLAYKSAQGRLHCWDGSTVRRAGLAVPAAPTLSRAGGASAVPAIPHYFRVRWIEVTGSTVLRRSEAGPSATLTPTAGDTITITRPTAASEGETHWEVEVSYDNALWFVFAGVGVDLAYGAAEVAIASTTRACAGGPGDILNLLVSPEAGTYTLQKSYKYIAADQGRLLGFGSYTTTDKQNDVEVSAIVGSLDQGDVERVDTTGNYRIGLDENDSGTPTGLVGPINGSFLPFKNRQVWLLTPTGSVDRPYRSEPISKTIGAISHRAIDKGEDETGNAVVFWMSHRGPYLWGLLGMQYIGTGIEDLILGPTSTINLAASKVVAHTTFFPDKRQVWFWFATGSSNDPDTLCIYDIQTKGWTRFTGGLASARCSVMFASTLGASMSRALKPYLGQTGANNRLWRADTTTADAGTAFQAYVVTKAAEPGGPGFYGAVGDALLMAKAADGVTITDTVTRDFGIETRSATAVLTLTAEEGAATRVTRRLEDSGFAGCQFVQHQIGDASAVSNSWTLDRLVVPYGKSDPVVG